VDGATGDGAIPDAPDANLRGTVRVTVTDLSGVAPASGASVVFMDPGDSLVATVATDLFGHAQADLLPGGSVTAVFMKSPNEYDVYSALDVQPGDDLAIVPRLDDSPMGTFTVNYPVDSGATSYNVYGPCGMGSSNGTSATLTMYRFCTTNPMTISVDAFGSNGLQDHLEKAGVVFTDGGSITLSPNWTAFLTLNETLSNIPSTVGSVRSIRYAPNRAAHGVVMGQAPPSNSNVAFNTLVPISAGSAMRVDLFQTGSTASQTVWQQTASGAASTFGLDVGANMLPWVGKPVVDSSTRTITTGTTGGAVAPDVGILYVIFTRAGTTVAWTVAAPSLSTVTLPDIPASLGPVSLESSDVVSAAAAYLVDVDSYAGYEEARASAFTLFQESYDIGGPWPATTTTLRASESP
jgi:hypothetical protein